MSFTDKIQHLYELWHNRPKSKDYGDRRLYAIRQAQFHRRFEEELNSLLKELEKMRQQEIVVEVNKEGYWIFEKQKKRGRGYNPSMSVLSLAHIIASELREKVSDGLTLKITSVRGSKE